MRLIIFVLWVGALVGKNAWAQEPPAETHLPIEGPAGHPHEARKPKPHVLVPTPQGDGDVYCSPQGKFAYIESGKGHFVRVNLEKRTSLSFLPMATPAALKYFSDDGKLAISDEGQVFDLSVGPPAQWLATEPGKRNLPASLQETDSFLSDSSVFRVTLSTPQRPPAPAETRWKLVDVRTGETQKEYSVPGKVLNHSPDGRYVAYRNAQGEVQVRDLIQDKSVTIPQAPGNTYLSVTFRGSQAVVAQVGYGSAAESYDLWKMDLEPLTGTLTSVGGHQEVNEAMVKALEEARKAGKPIAFGPTLRLREQTEIFSPVGGLRFGSLDRRPFDPLTHQGSPIVLRPELNEELDRGECGSLRATMNYTTRHVSFYPPSAWWTNPEEVGRIRSLAAIESKIESHELNDFLIGIEALRSHPYGDVFLENKVREATAQKDREQKVVFRPNAPILQDLGSPSYPIREKAYLELAEKWRRSEGEEHRKLAADIDQVVKAMRNGAPGNLERGKRVLDIIEPGQLPPTDSHFKLERWKQAQEMLSGLLSR